LAFQLNIRHNIETAQTVFGRGTVTQFDQPVLTVGRDPSCGCRIDAEEFEPEHFRIEFKGAGRPARVHPNPGAELYVGDERVDAARELLSGDVLRVGHWTLLFQKVYPRAGRSSHTSMLATLAKVLVAAILLSEILLVVWLPRRMRHIALWKTEIAKQRIALVLHTLRRRNKDAEPKTELEAATRDAVQQELDSRARYLRTHEDALTPDQRETMYDDLIRLGEILDRVDAGDVVKPVGEVSVDDGVRALLEKGKE
jgi:inorganic triphosphatase YgiF